MASSNVLINSSAFPVFSFAAFSASIDLTFFSEGFHYLYVLHSQYLPWFVFIASLRCNQSIKI